MKKIISSILCVSLLASIISVPVYATEELVATENTEQFCDDLTGLVEEYADVEYITPEDAVLEAEEAYGVEDMNVKYCSRLIVQSEVPVEKYGAVDVVSGFSNFYIVQFENKDDTNYAYEKYSADEDVLSVRYDVSYSGLQISSEDFEKPTVTYEDYLNSWHLESTGIKYVLEKYKNENLPEIVIGLVDSGYDFSNNYFSDRIIRTNFNNAGDGDENSEQDYDGHGTKLTSIIANSTTDNVKMAHYRCTNYRGVLESVALGAAAILAAVDDGVDVVNCSFQAFGADELFEEVIDYAYERNCLIFNCANSSFNLEISQAHPLITSPKTITVNSTSIGDTSFGSSAFSKPVNIFAPGEDIPVCGLDNTFSYASGTSVSTAIMSGIYAMFYATHQNMSFEDRMRAIKSCGDEILESYTRGIYCSGVVNAMRLFELETIEEPTLSHNERQYDGKVSLEMYAEDGAEIYYTTDGTFPTKINGTLYTEPYEFENADIRFRAVAYKNGTRSNCITKDIASMFIGTDDMFTVTEDGVITAYSGNVEYLKIPEYINGIKIIDLQYEAFQSEELKGVVMPDTVEYLGWTDDDFDRVIKEEQQLGCFNSCTNLEYIWGYNVKALGYYALQGLSFIKEMFFPECEEIYPRAFYWSFFYGVNFPKVKRVGYKAFDMNHNLREVYLPECEEISYGAFDMTTHAGGCSSDLTYFYAPKANFMADVIFVDEEFYTVDSPEATEDIFRGWENMTHLDVPAMETFGTNSFKGSAINRLDLSSAQYIYSLPNIMSMTTDEPYYSDYYLPVTVELCLPATLKYCVPTTDYIHDQMSYAVYGTKGTYSEQWATANKVPFYEITQETAIVEDIEPVWDKYSYKPLEFDARGFNRTYQWYGSYDAEIGNDIEITNATDKTFNPDEYKAYPYYYCIMTSTDKNTDGETVSKVTVTSSMCENRLYYMFAGPDSYINSDNNLIYTKTKACTDILDLITIQKAIDYYANPSYTFNNNYWYGTGSELVIYDDEAQEKKYMLIVEGDINGDSAVDVLDAFVVSSVANNHTTLADAYFLAADTNTDQEITVEDYAQVVNLVLAG